MTATATADDAGAPDTAVPSSSDSVGIAPLDAISTKKLQRARAKAAARAWKDAAAILEDAARGAPQNPIIAGELVWALLNLRDYDRASKAATTALALPAPPTIRAQVLYNAGRVAQAMGGFQRAKTLYAESVRLRPNEEVQDQLDCLDGSKALSPNQQQSSPGPCPRGASVSAVRSCLQSAVRNTDPASPPRHVTDHGNTFLAKNGFHVFEAPAEDPTSVMGGDLGFVSIHAMQGGALTELYFTQVGMSARYKVTGTFALDSLDEKPIAGHDTVWIRYTLTESNTCGPCNAGLGAITTSKTTNLVICVSTTGTWTCPFATVVAAESSWVPMSSEGTSGESRVTYGVEVNGGVVSSTLREGVARDASCGARGKLF